ncbi:AMP-binding protein, partial [Pseudoalteromonas luteoviolacea]|uniref:AMP-binding protein n=1 Tax=Pseudoalteromonas luteoviolacea TaxID=43657 RepID=UPI001F351CA1
GQSLTYKELDRRANQLAHYLRNIHGVGPDKLVGVCLERGFEMVISIMGILKAGGAYVPLDPSYPGSRLAYMVKDACMDTVLTVSSVSSRLPEGEFTQVLLDELTLLDGYSEASPKVIDTAVTSDNLAYVIYTSGSTGQPKGVMVEH